MDGTAGFPLLLVVRPLLFAAERLLEPEPDFEDVGADADTPRPDSDAAGAAGEGGGRDAPALPRDALLPPPLEAFLPLDPSFSAPFFGLSAGSVAAARAVLEEDEVEVGLFVGADAVAFDVFAAPAAAVEDEVVEPPPDEPGTLRLPLELFVEPSAAARCMSRVFLAPRSLRKSRRAFCGFASSLPSDSRMSA